MHGNALGDRAIGKRWFTRQHKIQRTTHAVDIGTRINFVAVDGLLRRQEICRPQQFFIMHYRQRGVLFLEKH